MAGKCGRELNVDCGFLALSVVCSVDMLCCCFVYDYLDDSNVPRLADGCPSLFPMREDELRRSRLESHFSFSIIYFEQSVSLSVAHCHSF